MSVISARSRAGGSFNYIRFVMRLRVPTAIATMVLAVVGLATNFLNVDLFARPLGDGAATHPIAALCLFGIGLCALRLRRFGRAPTWRYALGLGIIGVCVTRLMQAELSQMTGAPAGAIFGPIAGFSGRFSVESALTLGAFATAAVLRQSLSWWGMVFLVIGLATVSNAFLEVSYGMVFFNGDVGAFTMLGLMCAAISMITAYIHRPFMRVFFLAGNIGNQTRTMVAAALFIPWACGYFLHAVRDIELNSIPFEAVMVSIIIWSMLIVILGTAARLESTDLALRRAEREIVMLGRIDPLTKALNRRSISEMLDTAWVTFKSSGTLSGVLLLDVDYFRRVNATFGQYTEEDVLERVATTVQEQLRDHDALARWNEDEFLILLKIKDRSDLDVVVSRLTAALSVSHGLFCANLDGEPPCISATFGIGDMREKDAGPADMISRADAGLHVAKEALSDQVITRYELSELTEALVFKDGFDELEIEIEVEKDAGLDEIAA